MSCTDTVTGFGSGQQERRVNMVMRLTAVVLTGLLSAPLASAQSSSSSSSGTAASPAGDATGSGLPVSLDRIREGLKKPAGEMLLRDPELPADFRVEIVEQAKIDEMMSKLDFKSGPVPAGGLYAFEQQQRAFRPGDRPLMQPYAAYSGGEFLMIALENLLFKYLGKPALEAAANAGRARAERNAREEVDESIAEYCAGRPDRADIQICTDPPRGR